MGIASSPIARKLTARFDGGVEKEVQQLTRPPKKTNKVSNRLYPAEKIAKNAALTRDFHRNI